MKLQAQHFGAEYLHAAVTDADFSVRPFRIDIEGDERPDLAFAGGNGRGAHLDDIARRQRGVSDAADELEGGQHHA